VTWDKAVDPGGFVIERAIVQHRGSAVMMAVDDKNRALLVRQYRLPARKYMWELPAGRLDAGESVLKAARRELAEETGYRARKWTRLVHFWNSPGYVAETMTIYVAQELSAGEATPMEDERIECRWFTMPQIAKMISRGAIQDAKTIIGWSMWTQRRAMKRGKK
jgi:ADP-ribose pyrophosphatase